MASALVAIYAGLLTGQASQLPITVYAKQLREMERGRRREMSGKRREGEEADFETFGDINMI